MSPVHLLTLCPLWNLMNRYLDFRFCFVWNTFFLLRKTRLCSIGALQELMSLLISESYRNATVYPAESSCHTRSYGTCSCHICLALKGSHKSLDSCSKSELVKSSWNLKPAGLVPNPAPVFVHSPTRQKTSKYNFRLQRTTIYISTKLWGYHKIFIILSSKSENKTST